MNVSSIYSKLYGTISTYCTNIIGETNNYIVEKHFDIESQKNVDIVVNLETKLLTNSYEYVDNNNYGNVIDVPMPEYLILGGGFDKINGFEWKRTSINDDYIVLYKGSHLIPFEQIKQLYNKIKHKECIYFEKILKLYIDCGKNLDLTLTYFEL